MLAAGWSLVAAATVLGWRRVAAAGASVAAMGEAVRLGARYAGDPASLVTSWWQLMLAVTVALAAIVALAGAAASRRPLTRRAIGGTLAAAALAVAAPAISAAFTTVTPLGSGGAAVMSSPLDGMAGDLRYGLFALIAVTVMTVVAGIARPARRRVLIMALPVGSAAALAAWGFGGFLAASGRFTPPVMLTAPQWAALATVPLLSFAAAATWLSRHERMLRPSPRPGSTRPGVTGQATGGRPGAVVTGPPAASMLAPPPSHPPCAAAGYSWGHAGSRCPAAAGRKEL